MRVGKKKKSRYSGQGVYRENKDVSRWGSATKNKKKTRSSRPERCGFSKGFVHLVLRNVGGGGGEEERIRCQGEPSRGGRDRM